MKEADIGSKSIKKKKKQRNNYVKSQNTCYLLGRGWEKATWEGHRVSFLNYCQCFLNLNGGYTGGDFNIII